MDIGTGLSIVGSARLLERLLGPTADYIGEGIKGWTEKRVANVDRILRYATKLSDRIDQRGAVPPKVLGGVLKEGSFCDDELCAQYFGGVLASSKSEISRDDRGASYVALLGRLSTYQIRAHYCFYHLFKRESNGVGVEDLTLGTKKGRESLEIAIPLLDYFSFMGFDVEEEQLELLPHIMSGLLKELLIADRFETGAGVLLGERYVESYFNEDEAEEFMDAIIRPELAVQPTSAGIELFLWAHGKGNLSPLSFFDADHSFELDSTIVMPRGPHKVKSS